MIRRAAAFLGLALAACSGGDAIPTPTPATTSPASVPAGTSPPPATVMTKVADSVVQASLQVIAARTRGASGDEIAALSTPIVHVRADGAVEVELHTLRVVRPAELEELRALGVETVTTATTPAVPGQPPASVVVAWVPAERLPATAALPWIASITAPSYGINDTGGS